MRISAVLLLFALAPLACAHNGPPFAIMVDRKRNRNILRDAGSATRRQNPE